MWIERHPVPDQTLKKVLPKKEMPASGEDLSESASFTEQPSEWSLKPFQDELALEDHMEREFWRLIESQSEAVEIEYGADIHSSTYGR